MIFSSVAPCTTELPSVPPEFFQLKVASTLAMPSVFLMPRILKYPSLESASPVIVRSAVSGVASPAGSTAGSSPPP